MGLRTFRIAISFCALLAGRAAMAAPLPLAFPPEAVSVRVSAYPDSSAWHGSREPVRAEWSLEAGVTDVATALNQAILFDPTVGEGAIAGKTFQVPSDGIWYLHVRGGNAAGWGATTHVRLAVDTVSPAPFALTIAPAPVTDNPTVSVSYRTEDDLSGLATYEIFVDGELPVRTKEETYSVAGLAVGDHVVHVDAIDLAGNRTSASSALRIVPIPSPTLNPVTTDLYAGEGGLEVGGTAGQGTRLSVSLASRSGEPIGTATVAPGADGSWSARFDEPLKAGDYIVSVAAGDDRGAVSLPVRMELPVASRPLFVFRGTQISKWQFDVAVGILVLLGFLAGWEVRCRQRAAAGWYADIARRDVATAFDEIQADASDLSVCGKPGKMTIRDMENVAGAGKRLRQRLRRFRQYVMDSIRETRD
ncbi:MAG: hypothetical protein WCO25_01960 [Candidatus Uhrbacteria bacterium]